MRGRYGSGSLLAVVLTFSAACDSPVETADMPAVSLSIVSGSGQTGAVGAELGAPLVVRVTRQQNKKDVGVANQLVNFRVLTGGGSVFAGSALTNADGSAQEYWTLGPAIGENVLEVRAVDANTGEKQVFARFNAFGVIVGPEVCNGLDDNLDGTADDPTWIYCSGGVPAPNTDGKNACAAGYIDLNTSAPGCERLVAGRWTLSPPVTLSCPGIPLVGFLFNPISVSSFTVSVASPTSLSVRATFGIGSITEYTLENEVPIALIPAGESFSGSTPFSFADVDLTAGISARGSGTATLDGAFTGPASFLATFTLTLDFIFQDVPLLGDVNADCQDVNVTVTGTRVDS